MNDQKVYNYIFLNLIFLRFFGKLNGKNYYILKNSQLKMLFDIKIILKEDI